MKKSTKSGGSKLGNKASAAAKPATTAASRREQLGKRGGDLARFAQPLKPKVAAATNPEPAST